MTKADLVAKIAEDAGITKAQAEKVLAAFTGTVEAALKAGDKVTLIGFGTFSAVSRAARIGRNPATGKEIKIAAKTNGKFTPGSALKDIGSKKKETKAAAKPVAKKAAPKTKTKK
jgi:DNA-binding protein HU-beta